MIASLRTPVYFIQSLSAEGRRVLLLLTAVACIVLPYFGHLPSWAIGVVCVVYLCKLWLLARQAKRLNRWLLVVLSVAVSIGTVLYFGNVLGRDTDVTLLVMLICVKLLELHTRRDTLVIICLGFFLAICQFLYSQSITTAIAVSIGVVALVTALVGQNLDGDPALDPPPPLSLALHLALRMLLFAVPMTLALFLLFPRIPGPLWGSPAGTPSSSTGLSDTMSPGSMSGLAESDAIAFRVKFDGEPPAQKELYWRAIVLGAYDGRTWRVSPPQAPEFTPKLRVEPAGRNIDYTMTIEPHNQRWVFTLEAPLMMPVIDNGDRSNPVTATGDFSFNAARPFLKRTQVRGRAAPRGAFKPIENAVSLQNWIDLPAGYNPRTLQLAAELSSSASNNTQLVQRVLERFRNQPYRYTLSPPLLGRNAIDEFLFETRAGFCEHYAAAFVVLMRALDIPARVVTGYQGGDFNPVDGYLEVRQRDAHAWAEVWLGNAGWVRIDPTAAVAPSRVEHGLISALPEPSGFAKLMTLSPDGTLSHALQGLRNRWSAVNNSWNQWVLHYNYETQRELFQRFGFANPNWRDLMFGAVAALALLSVLLSIGLLAKRRHRDPVLRLYARLDSKLMAIGLGRNVSEGPGAYRDRVCKALDSTTAAQLQRVFDTFIALRYANADVQPSQTLKALSQWIAQLRINNASLR